MLLKLYLILIPFQYFKSKCCPEQKSSLFYRGIGHTIQLDTFGSSITIFLYNIELKDYIFTIINNKITYFDKKTNRNQLLGDYSNADGDYADFLVKQGEFLIIKKKIILICF